jgi:hypothetical protein
LAGQRITTQSASAVSAKDKKRSQALSVRSRPKEVTIDRCGMLLAMLLTPSEDRCPRSSASRDGFSTLRTNTQHRTNSSIRCNVSHAQHAFPMRHKSKSICTNNIAAKERTGDSYIAPLQFDLIATALSLGRSIVWRSFRNTGFPG